MINILTNALNKTIKNAGGPDVLTGSVIQAHNEPMWYTTFTTKTGGTLLLEIIWRDGGVVASVLNEFNITNSLKEKIVNHFIRKIEMDGNMPPLYDDDGPPGGC